MNSRNGIPHTKLRFANASRPPTELPALASGSATLASSRSMHSHMLRRNLNIGIIYNETKRVLSETLTPIAAISDITSITTRLNTKSPIASR